MSDDEWKCSEQGFGDLLIAHPCLDGNADLQWWLHRTYWQHQEAGHRAALNACIAEARKRGVTANLYTDPTTKRKILQRSNP